MTEGINEMPVTYVDEELAKLEDFLREKDPYNDKPEWRKWKDELDKLVKPLWNISNPRSYFDKQRLETLRENYNNRLEDAKEKCKQSGTQIPLHFGSNTEIMKFKEKFFNNLLQSGDELHRSENCYSIASYRDKSVGLPNERGEASKLIDGDQPSGKTEISRIELRMPDTLVGAVEQKSVEQKSVEQDSLIAQLIAQQQQILNQQQDIVGNIKEHQQQVTQKIQEDVQRQVEHVQKQVECVPQQVQNIWTPFSDKLLKEVQKYREEFTVVVEDAIDNKVASMFTEPLHTTVQQAIEKVVDDRVKKVVSEEVSKVISEEVEKAVKAVERAVQKSREKTEEMVKTQANVIEDLTAALEGLGASATLYNEVYLKLNNLIANGAKFVPTQQVVRNQVVDSRISVTSSSPAAPSDIRKTDMSKIPSDMLAAFRAYIESRRWQGTSSLVNLKLNEAEVDRRMKGKALPEGKTLAELAYLESCRAKDLYVAVPIPGGRDEYALIVATGSTLHPELIMAKGVSFFFDIPEGYTGRNYNLVAPAIVRKTGDNYVIVSRGEIA